MRRQARQQFDCRCNSKWDVYYRFMRTGGPGEAVRCGSCGRPLGHVPGEIFDIKPRGTAPAAKSKKMEGS